MPVRLILLLVATFAGCAAFVVWAQHRQKVLARREAWDAREADQQLLAGLDQVVVADGRALKLADLPAYLEAHTGVPVEIDETHVSAVPINPEERTIVLPEGEVSARALLEHALLQCHLGFEVQRGRVLITTHDRLARDEALYLAVYPAPQPGLTAASSEDEWYDLVSTIIQPQTWDEVGGQGHLQALPGGLAVVQSRQVQEEIGALFTRLVTMENPPRSWESVPLYPPAPSPAEQRIEHILGEIVSIDVQDQPLNMLASDLSYEYKLPIVLFERKMAEAGVSIDTPVTLKLSQVPLRSALLAMLDQLELGYLIRHEMVRISTPEDVYSELETVAYPVHDLVASKSGPDFDSLIEVITTNVAPSNWDEVGGPGAISSISRGWLIVSQMDEVHAQIADLLANLRRALAEGGSRPLPLELSPLEQQIELALEREIAFDYPRTELTDVCLDLSNQLGINVRLNARKLEEAGVNIDTPIIGSFPRASARVQLSRLCDALELTFCIRDDVLWLTTPEDAEDQLVTCIFDTRPLIDPDLGLTDTDGLIELIQSHIEPNSWDEVGGPGANQEFRGLLVISQSQEVQRQVAALLGQLETLCLPRVGSGDDSAVVQVPENPREQRIVQALLSPVDVNLCGVPLDEALRELSARAGVPITLDMAALANDDVSYRTLLSYSAHQLPLGQVLHEVLRPLDLEYGLVYEQILVSSAQSSMLHQPLRLYPAADLMAAGSEADVVRARIEAEVDPQHWDSQGGPNALAIVGNRWLAARATIPVHAQLMAWLQTARNGGPTASAHTPDAIPLDLDSQLRLPTQVAADLTPEQLAAAQVSSPLLTGACELAIDYRRPEDPRALREVLPPERDPFAPPASDDPFADPAPGATP